MAGRPRAQTRLNPAGVRRLLKAPEVEADMRRRAEEVARAARDVGVRVEGEPGDVDLPVNVTTSSRGSRVRARVTVAHPAAAAVEAKHRLLGRALDAAGGRS